MEVDFKNNGDAYKLTAGTRKVKGCQVLVELYESLLPSGLADFERDMKLWCRWMPIEVTLNGVRIAKDPKDFGWTYDTDEAYIN